MSQVLEIRHLATPLGRQLVDHTPHKHHKGYTKYAWIDALKHQTQVLVILELLHRCFQPRSSPDSNLDQADLRVSKAMSATTSCSTVPPFCLTLSGCTTRLAIM